MAVNLPPKPWEVGASFDTERGLTYTFDGERWLSDGQVASPEDHEHDDLATKSDLESLEAELELLAKTLETGQWTVIDNQATRAGEMWLFTSDFSKQNNQIIINNEDMSGKSHGWAALHEGDYLEMLDKSDQKGRNIEHDYALYVVTKVDKGSGLVTIDLDLYSGQGSADAGDVFEVRILDIAESELDMAALDDRYVKSSGTTEIPAKFQLTGQNDSGTKFIMQKIDGGQHYLYQLPNPTSTTQATPKSYVDSKMNHTHKGNQYGGGSPYSSKTGLPAWNRAVWSASHQGSSAFTPYVSRHDGYHGQGNGSLIKDTSYLLFRYPEVHKDDLSGNGCIVFSEASDSIDKMFAVFQILYAVSSSANSYTKVNVVHLWSHYPDTMKWKFDANTGNKWTSTEVRWGYMMVTAGGYWGPR